VRFRAPPFTPEVVREGLAAAGLLAASGGNGGAGNAANSGADSADLSSAGGAKLPENAPWPKSRRGWAWLGGAIAGVVTALLAIVGWRPSLAPVHLSAPVYSAETVERGRVLAAAGNCMVCHTADGGVPGAGGRAMRTDFGTVYSTNLTPDAETGLGTWSFSAFQRAMRQGISRDGHHLYPAFPYTAFARLSDDDLQALFAYLMSQPVVRHPTPAADMRFPYNLRPLLAGWNALHLDAQPYAPDPVRSAEWNRGAYLVQGLGHCGACHTSRGPLAGERGGAHYLAGAMVRGWEAPALTAKSHAAVPWDAEALYAYLRRGHSPRHGSTGGPMADVVRSLQAVPDADIRAMATYLASFQAPNPDADALQRQAQAVVAQAAGHQDALLGPGQRFFEVACSACHHDGDGPKLLGVNTPLALSSKLTSERPDNLIRTILEGVREPATTDIGFMAGFADALSDAQIADVVAYMRARYAPQAPAWQSVQAQVARVRATALAGSASDGATQK
jgi:nicotinate dehydrogenase subunit B